MLPRDFIFARKISIPADTAKFKLWQLESTAMNINGVVVPLKTTLLDFTSTQVDGISLKLKHDSNEAFPAFDSRCMPGLTYPIEDFNLTAHINHELSCWASNNTMGDLDLTYYFHLCQEAEDESDIIQRFSGDHVSLQAYETEYQLGSFRVSPGRILLLYQMAFTQVAGVIITVKKCGQLIPPVDGIPAETGRGIEHGIPVSYICNGDQSEYFEIQGTNMTAHPIDFAWRLIAVDAPEAYESKIAERYNISIMKGRTE
jgi:hypothetical protein